MCVAACHQLLCLSLLFLPPPPREASINTISLSMIVHHTSHILNSQQVEFIPFNLT